MGFTYTDLSKEKNLLGFESGIVCLYPNYMTDAWIKESNQATEYSGCKGNQWYIDNYHDGDAAAAPGYYDPRCRAWYQMQHGKAHSTWSDVYRYANGRLGITNCVPLWASEPTNSTASDTTAASQDAANEGEEERIIEGEEDDGAPSKDAILAKLRKGGATNVLANFPPPKESQERESDVDALDGSLPEKASGTLDLKASEYFTKYPKAIANPQVCGLCYCHSCDFISFPQERSLKLFNEDAEGLPEGWKVRAAVANISI